MTVGLLLALHVALSLAHAMKVKGSRGHQIQRTLHFLAHTSTELSEGGTHQGFCHVMKQRSG